MVEMGRGNRENGNGRSRRRRMATSTAWMRTAGGGGVDLQEAAEREELEGEAGTIAATLVTAERMEISAIERFRAW